MLVGDEHQLALRFLEALAEMHRHGVVHGDVKPSNTMLDEDGLIKIIDLGAAFFHTNNGGFNDPGHYRNHCSLNYSDPRFIQYVLAVHQYNATRDIPEGKEYWEMTRREILKHVPEDSPARKLFAHDVPLVQPFGNPRDFLDDAYAAGLSLEEMLLGIQPYDHFEEKFQSTHGREPDIAEIIVNVVKGGRAYRKEDLESFCKEVPIRYKDDFKFLTQIIRDMTAPAKNRLSVLEACQKMRDHYRSSGRFKSKKQPTQKLKAIDLARAFQEMEADGEKEVKVRRRSTEEARREFYELEKKQARPLAIQEAETILSFSETEEDPIELMKRRKAEMDSDGQKTININ